MRIAVCDDNQDFVNQYAKLFTILAKRHDIEVTIETYNSGSRLLFAQEDVATRADIIFLDIYMPTIDGLTVARKLRELNLTCEIVFLTQSRDMMLDAFDVSAFHYVIKGRTPSKKLEEIFLRAYKKIKAKNKETIVFSCAGESRSIAVEDILYFESIRHIITVHYADKTFDFYSTLGRVENLLFNRGFVRVHRSYLVSKRHIVGVAHYIAKLDNGEELPIGKANYKEMRDVLKDKG